MIDWIIAHPYTSGAIFYAVLLTGVMMFMRGAADQEVNQ